MYWVLGKRVSRNNWVLAAYKKTGFGLPWNKSLARRKRKEGQGFGFSYIYAHKKRGFGFQLHKMHIRKEGLGFHGAKGRNYEKKKPHKAQECDGQGLG